VDVQLLRGGGTALPRGRGSALCRVRLPRARRQRAVTEARARAALRGLGRAHRSSGRQRAHVPSARTAMTTMTKAHSWKGSRGEAAQFWCSRGDLTSAGTPARREEDAFFSVLEYSMLAVDSDLRDLYMTCDPPTSSRTTRWLKGGALCRQLAEMARRDRNIDAAEPQARSDLSPRTQRRSSTTSSVILCIKHLLCH
jgi:hypothetical protein